MTYKKMGRSVIEMLGVWAIIGMLSLVGISTDKFTSCRSFCGKSYKYLSMCKMSATSCRYISGKYQRTMPYLW